MSSCSQSLGYISVNDHNLGMSVNHGFHEPDGMEHYDIGREEGNANRDLYDIGQAEPTQTQASVNDVDDHYGNVDFVDGLMSTSI